MTTEATDHHPGRTALLFGLSGTFLVAGVLLSLDEPWTLRGDNGVIAYPMTLEAYRSWSAGRLPEWSTRFWAGFPLASDPNGGALYPLHGIAFWSTPAPLHLRAYDVASAMHVGIFLAGAFRLLTLLGASRASAGFGALLAATCPLHLWWASGMLMTYGAIAWWPSVMVACERLGRDGATTRHWVLGWAALAAQVLVGYPEFALYSGIVGAAWLMTGGGKPLHVLLARALWLAMGALALAAPQIMVTASYAAETTRGVAYDAHFASILSLAAIKSLWSVLLPVGIETEVRPIYLGLATPILAVLGFVSGAPRRRFLIALALTAFVLSLGALTPVWSLLHSLPLFSPFRNPKKFWLFVDLALALLAAFGVQRLATASHGRRRRVVLVVLLAAIAIGERTAHTALRIAADEMPRPSSIAPLLRRLELSGLEQHPAVRQRPSPRLLDLTRTGNLPAIHGVDSLRGGMVALLGRVHGHLLSPEHELLWRIASSATGPDLAALRLPTSRTPSRLTDPPLMDRFAVDLVLAHGRRCGELMGSGLRPVHRNSGVCLLANPRPTARYVFPDRWQRVATSDAMIAPIEANPDGPTPLVASGADVARYLDDAATTTVVLRSHEPGRIGLVARTSRPRMLLVRESWAPGWRATMDDEPVPVFRAGGLFFAVPVDPGERDVVLTYRAPGLRGGYAIAFVWLLLTALCATRRALRRAAAGRALAAGADRPSPVR